MLRVRRALLGEVLTGEKKHLFVEAANHWDLRLHLLLLILARLFLTLTSAFLGWGGGSGGALSSTRASCAAMRSITRCLWLGLVGRRLGLTLGFGGGGGGYVGRISRCCHPRNTTLLIHRLSCFWHARLIWNWGCRCGCLSQICLL